jgi:glutamate formiminotransferase/formiminotetrahydrofolate cyclodeaminase
MARHGNMASASDLEVGARCLETGIWGASRNAVINLRDVTDETFKAEVRAEAERLAARARERCAELLSLLSARAE